mmetsp:Transcript_38053/g.104705  ORF Transcript_38053/g.104705 Transcript_38053/m.104705 type:complete len:270 (+) Transcript_38053:41-850(+)
MLRRAMAALAFPRQRKHDTRISQSTASGALPSSKLALNGSGSISPASARRPISSTRMLHVIWSSNCCVSTSRLKSLGSMDMEQSRSLSSSPDTCGFFVSASNNSSSVRSSSSPCGSSQPFSFTRWSPSSMAARAYVCADSRSMSAWLSKLASPASATSVIVAIVCSSNANTFRSLTSAPRRRNRSKPWSRQSQYDAKPFRSLAFWWMVTTLSTSARMLPGVAMSFEHSTLMASSMYLRASFQRSRRTMQCAMMPACQPNSGLFVPRVSL